MENKRKLWIRPVTFNFVSVTILAVLIMLAGILGTLSLSSASTVKADIKTEIDETFENAGEDGIDDVEGYSLIFYGLGYGIATIGEVFGAAIILLCGLGAFIIFFPALLARLLYKNSDGRILAYRIIMGIDYVIITAIALMMLGGSALLTDWLIPLGILAIVVCGIINTYSNRIRTC